MGRDIIDLLRCHLSANDMIPAVAVAVNLLAKAAVVRAAVRAAAAAIVMPLVKVAPKKIVLLPRLLLKHIIKMNIQTYTVESLVQQQQ